MWGLFWLGLIYDKCNKWLDFIITVDIIWYSLVITTHDVRSIIADGRGYYWAVW